MNVPSIDGINLRLLFQYLGASKACNCVCQLKLSNDMSFHGHLRILEYVVAFLDQNSEANSTNFIWLAQACAKLDFFCSDVERALGCPFP